MTGLEKSIVPDLPSAQEILPYLRRIDEARWYSNFGPLAGEFEERVSRLLSTNDLLRGGAGIHTTMLASCHHALEIGLHLLGAGPGKRVLLPAVTFPACALAVENIGAEAVLADVHSLSWTLTPQIARAAANRIKVDAVMPVTTYGVPLPSAEWDEFSRDTAIPVIIDAATAFEVQSIPRRGFVATSFHATKPFGIGEGGALIGRDPDLISRAKQYSNFGLLEDRICRMRGFNGKMSEYHAAVGLSQFDRWAAIKSRRRDLLQVYRRYLAPLEGSLSLQPSIEKAVISSFMILLSAPIASTILSKGKEKRIAFHRAYLPPLYHHPHFSHLSVIDGTGECLTSNATAATKQAHMVNSEKLFRQAVGVPFHSFISQEHVEIVTKELSEALINCGAAA